MALSPSTRRWMLAGIVVTLLAAGFGLWRRHVAALATAREAARHLAFRFAWPRGSKYTYAVAWKGESAAVVPDLGTGAGAGGAPGSVAGSVDFDVDLVLRSYGEQADGRTLMRASLESVRRHGLTVLGKDALPSDSDAHGAFDGAWAWVEYDRSGTLLASYFKPGDSSTFKHVLQSILVQTSTTITPAGATSWAATERTSEGRSAVTYEVEDGAPPRIARTRTGYTEITALGGHAAPAGHVELTGRAEIELAPVGHLVALADREDLAVTRDGGAKAADYQARSTFDLRLRAVEAFDPDVAMPDLASFDARRPGEMVVSGDAKRRILEQRVAGLTFEQLRGDLFALALTGALPDKSTWLLRASGLLRLEPERCMDMAALFEDARMTDSGRAQVLDLLAGTGTEPAQAAMRLALESPAARKNPQAYPMLVQRLSLVAHPASETLAFLESSYTSAHGANDRFATAHALGAAAGNLARSGNPGDAAAYAKTLTRDLERARTPEEKKELLSAFGNVGLPAGVATIAPFVKDDAPAVRSTAAWALRKIDTDEARDALLDLAHDDDAQVEESVFQSLAYESMDSGDWGRLAASVNGGQTRPQADGALLALLAKNTDDGEPVASMLRTMLERNDADKRMQARIRHVLAAMQ